MNKYELTKSNFFMCSFLIQKKKKIKKKKKKKYKF